MEKDKLSTVEQIYVKETTACQITGHSVQTYRNYRHLGKGPKYVKAGRSVRYFLPDLYEWMESRKITPDAERPE